MEHEEKLNEVEMRMSRGMCGMSLREREACAELRQKMGAEDIVDVETGIRLPWYGPAGQKERLVEVTSIAQ